MISKHFTLVFLYTVVIQYFEAVSGELTYLGTRKVPTGNGKDFNENDYYVGANSAIWTSAVQDCKINLGLDAHLLSIESMDENDALLIWLQTAGATFGHYWTSGQYDANQGIWRWAAVPNATFDSYTNWAATEPSSTAPYKRVAFNFQNQFSSNWAVRDDTFLTRYICETPHNITDPENPIEPIPCTSPISLTIVLDSSLGMDQSNNFLNIKVYSVILAWAVTAATGSKLGLMTFSRGSYNIVKFGNVPSQEEIRQTVLEAEVQIASQRMTHEAMHFSMIFQDMLSTGLPMRMVVITNGISDFPSQTKDVATAANFLGIRTYAVGLEPADDADLLNIAFGASSRVFKTDWENHLLTLKPLVASICA